MTFGDLIFKLNPEQVIKRLVELYPGQRSEHYLQVLEELKTTKPKKTRFTILIMEYGDVRDKRDYISISGITKTDEKHWALDFIDWAEWLSMPIAKKSIEYFSLIDILCHCLWEMTFFGFTSEKVKNKINKLRSDIDEIKKEYKKNE